jgi:putative hydrolase of the HAD superfamily
MSDNLKGIKAIIFDLGNVIIDLHYERTVQRLVELSGCTAEELGEMLVQDPVLQEFEVGAISENEFRERFCTLIGIKLNDRAFDDLWNSFLGEIAPRRIEQMLVLRKKFQTYILSNTNSIHVRCFNAQMYAAHGISSLDELVEKVYYSHEVGMRKPNPAIYVHLLEKEGLQPDQTLFIDDRADNIEAAADLGIRTYHNRKVDDWLSIWRCEDTLI